MSWAVCGHRQVRRSWREWARSESTRVLRRLRQEDPGLGLAVPVEPGYSLIAAQAGDILGLGVELLCEGGVLNAIERFPVRSRPVAHALMAGMAFTEVPHRAALDVRLKACDGLVAFWDEDEGPSYTKERVRMFQAQRLPIVVMNPVLKETRMLRAVAGAT